MASKRAQATLLERRIYDQRLNSVQAPGSVLGQVFIGLHGLLKCVHLFDDRLDIVLVQKRIYAVKGRTRHDSNAVQGKRRAKQRRTAGLRTPATAPAV